MTTSPNIMPNIPSAATLLDTEISPRREQAIDFLLGRINYERTPVVPYGRRQLKLDRMRQLLTRLGNPDVGVPIVHVAGTKGKGSTSAMIAAMLHAAGYDTGLFSSPHLERIEERFAVNGLPCSGQELVALVDQLRPIVQAMDRESSDSDVAMSPTYFELTTALALMHFAQRKVDLAVLEVGLGGRLDSTNVCQPAVTVITSISLDHTKQLGNTLAKIATEKAGIIKPGVPVLCGQMDDKPRQVIEEIARQHGCRVFAAGRDFRHRYRPTLNVADQDELGCLDVNSDLTTQDSKPFQTPLRLLGDHQAANAALAVATVAELRRQGWLVSEQAVRSTLASLSLPGRVEIVSRRPTTVLDVAHNVASAEALVKVLQSNLAEQTRVLLLAATRDKDVRGIVRVLLPYFRRVVVTQYQENPRAVPTARLGQIVRGELKNLRCDTTTIQEESSPREAWNLAQQIANPNDMICVTGSFFIVAELRCAILASAQESAFAKVDIS